MKCTNCGVEVKEGQKFCLQCGALIPQNKKCIKCGAELPLDAKFCSECGAKLDGLEEPEEYDDEYLDSLSIEELLELESKNHNATVQLKIADSLREEDIFDEGLSEEDQKSNEKSCEWYRKAAEQGNIIAQFELGRMYEHGWGVSQDYIKAYDWYKKTADQGYGWGFANVADLYWEGNGVTQDYSKSCEWLQKAIDHGCLYVAETLAEAYEQGLGVSQNYKKAFELYKIASEVSDVNEALERLKSKI